MTHGLFVLVRDGGSSKHLSSSGKATMMEHSERTQPGDLCLMELKDISHGFLRVDTAENTRPHQL